MEKEEAGALVRAAQGEGRGPEADEAARKAETARALAQVLGLARGVDEIGATLTFTFWVEQGALTPLGYREESRGGRAGRVVKTEVLERVLHPVFAGYMVQRTGKVVLTLRREEARWAVDYDATHQEARPPEAKTLPVRSRGTTADSLLAFHEAARKGLNAVQVPAGSAERVELAVRLEDGRLVGWELVEARRTGEGPGGTPWPLSPELAGHAVQVLLPFSEGIGPRTVHLVLRAEHQLGEREARGRVESVRVERPPSAFALTPERNGYHAMHEAILLRWREDVYEGSAWLAQKGVDELALWCVGGILAKGVGFFGTKGLEWVPRALSRGPEAAAGWLRSALKRLPTQEKKVFEQLWKKVALEGEQALTRSERQTLRGLFVRLEQVIQQPLNVDQKGDLREEARTYYKKLYPQFMEVLDESTVQLPIHHRRQLEHAHLFPDEDINAGENLAMVRRYIHLKINFLWGRFRRARPNPTAEEVRRAAETIDRHFAPWYHRVDDPPGLSRTAEAAREAALLELKSQFPGLD
ncbi:hypothetical protein [Archangium sp.]|uniref:hypothetical protein n=1 Tax=Archangium sp. TaxID=1872627 RepID=UPI00286C80EB|nr:hypothetical protein [Archangium sp.]